MKKYDVIGIGVSALDILAIVENFPDKESVQQALEMKIQGGGPVSTAVVTMAKLGLKTAMIDVVGSDWCGELIMKEFREYGVSTDLIEVAEEHNSAKASILVRKGDGARAIAFLPGSASHMPIRGITPELISSTKIVHMNGRHLDECLKICEFAANSGVKISFDGGADRYRKELDRLIPLTNIFIAAKSFTTAYTGMSDIQKSADCIQSEGPEIVVITDGLNGSRISSETDGTFHQPAFKSNNIVDTTGCGDSYHGAFLYGMVNDMDLRKTASFASAVASLNTRALGGRTALPGIETVNSFIDNYKDSHK
ncbi:carbohydrate kinase family protein [candidate division KSB1 bacterium]